MRILVAGSEVKLAAYGVPHRNSPVQGIYPRTPNTGTTVNAGPNTIAALAATLNLCSFDIVTFYLVIWFNYAARASILSLLFS